MKSIIHSHLNGTPWHHTMAEVEQIIAGRPSTRAPRVAPKAQDDDVERKRCRDCERRRPLERFSKHPTTSDGLDGRCKDCKRDYDRRRRERLREAAGKD